MDEDLAQAPRGMRIGGHGCERRTREAFGPHRGVIASGGQQDPAKQVECVTELLRRELVLAA